MPSTKIKRRLFTALTILLYVGMPVFGALQLYPAMLSARADVAELDGAEATLGRWVLMTELPTQTRVDVVRGYKEGMAEEYDRVVSYFRHRNASLDRSLLDTASGDPVNVRIKYDRLKQVLKSRASNSITQGGGARDFMPRYPWEQPGGLPPRKDFEMLEKKAAIAELTIGLLGRKAAAVEFLAIGDPVEADGTPVDDLAARRAQAQAAESEGLDYIVWPVRVEMVAVFSRLGQTLNALVSPAARRPCMLVHGLDVKAAGSGVCDVTVNLGVLEFD